MAGFVLLVDVQMLRLGKVRQLVVEMLLWIIRRYIADIFNQHRIFSMMTITHIINKDPVFRYSFFAWVVFEYVVEDHINLAVM